MGWLTFLLIGCGAAGSTPQAAGSDCASCHPEQVEQWAHSRHAVAFTNAIFAHSYENSHYKAWCRECHAPLEDSLGPDAGVGCPACHPTHEAASEAAEACATCHQFGLPTNHPMYSEAAVQDTLAEWRRSPAAKEGKRCVACHMAGAGHRFPGAHDPSFVRAAVDIRAERVEGGVSIAMMAPGAGHHVPSGDPFRRLKVQVGEKWQWLQHTHEQPWVRSQGVSIPPDRELVVALPAGPGPVEWSVHYFYGEAQFESLLPDQEVSFVLARGKLP